MDAAGVDLGGRGGGGGGGVVTGPSPLPIIAQLLYSRLIRCQRKLNPWGEAPPL